MRRLTIAAVLLLVAATANGGDKAVDLPPPRLLVGQVTMIYPSEATRQASALIDVPPGMTTLHVMASAGAAVGIGIEAGPVDSSGAFVDFIRHEAGGGRVHLIRQNPTAGIHRIVVAIDSSRPQGIAVGVEFDSYGYQRLYDLVFTRPRADARRFRLVIPPHTGAAELRSSRPGELVRVRLKGPRGDLGDPTDLPTELPGTEGGATFELEILKGPWDVASRLELRVPTPGSPLVDDPSASQTLVPDRPTTVSIGGTGAVSADFELFVPTDSPGFRVTATAKGALGTHPDPELFVSRDHVADTPIDTAEYLGLHRGASESVQLGGLAGLAAGTYHVHLELVDEESPTDVTVTATALRAATPPVRLSRALRRGEWTTGSIHIPDDSTDWSSIRMPHAAKTLFIQVVDATADVDLLIADPLTGEIIARSMNFLIDERLTFALPDGTPRGERSLLVGVVARGPSEGDVDYRVAIATDAAPELPSDLRLPPFARATPLNDIETVAQAVAEIEVKDAAGSAVSIDSRGYLLTCRHVIVDDDTDAPTTGPILVAFPDDFRKAPRQAFRARVVESNIALDLALLEIVADVYGRKVSGDLGLPVIAFAEAAARLGDAVLVAGYPGDGSEQERPPVIVSRGVVAGLEVVSGQLAWLKTDAWIATGHSGGAVVDSTGKLLGIAAATLGPHDAMGLVRPIGLVPKAWLESRAKVHAPK